MTLTVKKLVAIVVPIFVVIFVIVVISNNMKVDDCKKWKGTLADIPYSKTELPIAIKNYNGNCSSITGGVMA